MYGIANPVTVSGVPVVAAPAEIDVMAAEQLRAVLLKVAARGHATIVVDMTRTQFCDSAGFSILIRAHRRALTEGGGLRLVIAPDSAVSRIFILTGLHQVIPWFGRVDQAVAARPAVAARMLQQRSPVVPGSATAAWRAGRGRASRRRRTC